MRVLLPVTVAVLISACGAQKTDPCASAPTPAAKIICQQIHRWDDKARTEAGKKKVVLPPGMVDMLGKGTAAEFAPIASTIYQCMDIACLCSYLRGNSGANGVCSLSNGFQLRKSVRKEYRMLTDDERARFHAAIKALKANGEYDNLARIHSQATNSGGAHSGPAFLPWHREYIKRMDFALKQVDPSVSLPYWDSTLDGALQNPKDSVMFSSDLTGATDASGNLVSGPFAPWRTLEGRNNIRRAVGAQGNCFSQNDIDFVLRQTQIDQVLSFTAPRQGCPYRTDFNCLEYTHGNVHIFIGGDMFDTVTAANDPIFYMHHCFVDLIWELWRQARQTRAQRETAYPPDNQLCASSQHFGAGALAPFTPQRNRDGLSNMYTDNLFQYAPRPTCSAAQPNCGSRFLFCDLSHSVARCASKLKAGAVCNMYTRGELPCYNGVCQGGRCVFSPTQAVTPPPTRPVPKPAQQETCFNENQCCASWAASGECARNSGYMSQWCKASCGNCHPKYRLVEDCSDRHVMCSGWSRSGECTKNPLWMAENCRRSCNKCGKSRAQECAAGRGQAGRPQPKCENSVGCFNENVCCPYWGLLGACRNNDYMSCDCRVSCGHCSPNDYNYGTCQDYHHDCAAWSRNGECEKNPWMSENCRQSCRTCYSQEDLRSMCGTRPGAVKPVSTAHRISGWNQGGMSQFGWAPQGGGGMDYDDAWGGPQWGGGGNRGWGRGRGRGRFGGGWGWGKKKRSSLAQPDLRPGIDTD